MQVNNHPNSSCGVHFKLTLGYWWQGIPFRTGHEIVGKAVACGVSKKVELAQLSLDEFKSIHPVFEEDVYSYLGVENCIKKFRSFGSTGAEPVSQQMHFWCEKLGIM